MRSVPTRILLDILDVGLIRLILNRSRTLGRMNLLLVNLHGVVVLVESTLPVLRGDVHPTFTSVLTSLVVLESVRVVGSSLRHVEARGVTKLTSCRIPSWRVAQAL